jgi:hypothetical protein
MTCTKIPPNRTLARSSMDSQFDSSRQAMYEKAALSEVEGRKSLERCLPPEPDLLVRAVAIRFPL